VRTQRHYRQHLSLQTPTEHSHFSDPHTPATEQIPCLYGTQDSLYCYFHSSEIWHSVTYQKNGILNHTTVKTSKLTLVMLILACCLTPTLSQVNSMHVPLLSNFKRHFNITVYDVAASFMIFWPKFWICFLYVPWIRKAKITFLLWAPVTSRP